MILYNVKYGYIKDPHVYNWYYSQHLEQADIILIIQCYSIYTNML